jgi:hypothetical protein
MRRFFQEYVTLDGFAAGPNGELDFFDAIAAQGDGDTDNLELLKSIDTMLLGATTYRLFGDFLADGDRPRYRAGAERAAEGSRLLDAGQCAVG